AILSSWAMTESLYGAMVLGILLLATRPVAEGRETRRWLALGLACGALYLLRANGLAIAAAIGLTALLPERAAATTARLGLGRRLVLGAIFATCFLACITPWLVRNQRLFGSPTWTAMKNIAWTTNGRELFRRDEPAPSLDAFRRQYGDAALAGNVA